MIYNAVVQKALFQNSVSSVSYLYQSKVFNVTDYVKQVKESMSGSHLYPAIITFRCKITVRKLQIKGHEEMTSNSFFLLTFCDISHGCTERRI